MNAFFQIFEIEGQILSHDGEGLACVFDHIEKSKFLLKYNFNEPTKLLVWFFVSIFLPIFLNAKK